MAWCCLSQWARLTARRLERQNNRLDALVLSGERLCREMQARAIARDAQTRASIARLGVFKLIKNPTHTDVLAYLARTDRKSAQRSPVACRLSTMLDVYIRRIDRHNIRREALAVPLAKMTADLRASRLQMDAETAASRARVAALLKAPRTFENLNAWIAQFDADQRACPSVVTQSTG